MLTKRVLRDLKKKLVRGDYTKIAAMMEGEAETNESRIKNLMSGRAGEATELEVLPFVLKFIEQKDNNKSKINKKILALTNG